MKGGAAQIVSSLLVTDANCDFAERKLEEHFNIKQSIVKADLAAIHTLPAFKKESNAELHKFLESTNEHAQALEALTFAVDQGNAILVYWLLENLDTESRKQFELTRPGTDVLTVNESTTFMNRRCRALQSSCDQPEASAAKTTPKNVHQEASYSSTAEHSASCQVNECNGS